MCMPFLNWFVETVSATAAKASGCRAALPPRAPIPNLDRVAVMRDRFE
jgi:hypothetical protein